MPLSAAVLAGGQSRRMGIDKSLLTLVQDGPPLAAIVVASLLRFSDDVYLVSPPRPAYAGLGAPVLPDLFGDTGVLGGIASAVAHARHERCLVVSCDMPFLNLELLRWMATKPAQYDVLVPRLRGESRQGGEFVFQTLHAIYRKSSLPAIERALAAGHRQTVSFLADVDVATVEEAEIRLIDPDLRSFFSVNTPEALATARDWWRTMSERDSSTTSK
jgi:molybdopterin-guanine dinucleotide biosynthesis protein A